MKHSLGYTHRFNKIKIKHQVFFKFLSVMTFLVSSTQAEYQANRVLAWVEDNFKQAEQHQHDYIQRSKEFIRSVKVYDMLSLKASFDVLFLTDRARKLFVDFHGRSQGLTFEEMQVLSQRQTSENKYFISAYVVAWHDEYSYVNSKALFTGSYQKSPHVLKGEDALWSVSLIVGGRRYLPESIKVVEMPIEYQQFFGPSCNQFATTYLVRFAAKDKFNNYIFTDQKSSPVLRFSSPTYKIDAIWKNINVYDSKN